MNKQFVDNIESFYCYAECLAPGYGHDVVHHIIDIVPDNVKQIEPYVKKTIRNELFNRKSSFNKLFRPINLDELIDVEQIEFKYKNYDAILLHRIFLEMEIEGYELQVQVFKDCYFGSSVYSFSKQSKLSRKFITKICKFVQDEIIRRYTLLDVD